MASRFRRFVDPDECMTNYSIMKRCGLVMADNLHSELHCLTVLLIVITAVTHFGVRVVLDFDKDIAKLMEIMHWLCLHLTCLGCGYYMMARSGDYREMHNIIGIGFYTYPEQLTDEQANVVRKGTDEIYFMVKLFAFLFITALVFTQAKGIMFVEEEWQLPFPGWFPFEINSYGRYTAGVVYQLLIGINLVSIAFGFVTTYVTHTSHLVSQLQVLRLTIREISKQQPTSLLTTQKRIVSCVDHHNIIIKYYNILRNYYNCSLLVIAITFSIMLCTIGCVLTDPNSNSKVIIPMFTVFIPELTMVVVYCHFGQKVIDSSDAICEEVYNTDWYKKPGHHRESLLMVMVAANKAFTITGGGLQQFSLKGMREILQASYTYFNMLSVMRSSDR